MKKIILLSVFILIAFYMASGSNFKADKVASLPGMPLLHNDDVIHQIIPRKANGDTVIANILARISSDSIQSYVQHLQNYGSRFCLKPGHKDISLWLQHKLQSFGYAQVMLDSFEINTEWPRGSGTYITNWQYNVIASQIGTISPQLQYIIGGHYDAIVQNGDPYLACPGADDNASGTAATLEIARVLQQYNFLFPATVKFILFDAEELGLYGSRYYVNQLLAAHQAPGLMLNLDMVGNNYGSTGWICDLLGYKGWEYAALMADSIVGHYANMGTWEQIFDEDLGSDSDPFFEAGMAALFFQENQFSPYYHTLADVDTNINFPYCTEVTRAACAVLMESSMSPSLVRFEIFNPGTGHSLIPCWKPNPESNITAYRIYVGNSTLNYDTVFTTVDTSFSITGLNNGTTYYIAVSAVNSFGREGFNYELSDAPAIVTLDQGVLIVDDSEGGYYNPSDSVVDAYYRYLCRHFTTTGFDATQNGAPTLADLGRYSSVVWHINKPNVLPKLRNSLAALKQYMQLGGNVLFTMFQPSRMFFATNTMSYLWRDGSFLHDMLKIDTTLIKSYAVCNGALPLVSGYNALQVDTNKTIPVNNHHLPYIDALFPSPQGTAIYAYQSNYTSGTAPGSMQGMTVGVEYRGNDYNAVLLSIPLYYCDSTQATNLMNYVLGNVFAEEPNSVEAYEDANTWAKLFPNPSSEMVTIQTHPSFPEQESVTFYDITGRSIKAINGLKGRQNTLNLSELPQGLYFVQLKCGDQFFKSNLLVIHR